MAMPFVLSDTSFSFELTPPLDTLLQLAALEGLSLQEVVATALQTVIDGCLSGCLNGTQGARGDLDDADYFSAASQPFRAVLASVSNTRTAAAAKPACISEVQAIFAPRLLKLQARTGFQSAASGWTKSVPGFRLTLGSKCRKSLF